MSQDRIDMTSPVTHPGAGRPDRPGRLSAPSGPRQSDTAPDRPACVARLFWRNEDAATSIEYALIAGIVFLGIVAAIRAYASQVGVMYGIIETAIGSQ